MSAVKTVSELGTNTLGVTYGDLSNAQSADIVYAESWNGDPAKSYTYDDLGRLSTNATHTSGGADLTASYTYKSFDTFRSSMLVSEYSSGEGYAYFYEYDDLGNITSETRGNKTTSYEYNEQGMLIRENNKRAGYTWVYTYPVDGNGKATSGNILSRKTYEYTVAATDTLGAPDSTDTFTYGNSAWGDLLTGCGNKTITYSGTRPVTYGDYSLSWYRGGLLSGFSKTGDTNTYTYDVSGRRLTKSHNGTTTTFIYAGDLLLGQKTGSNKLTFLFDSAGNYFGFDYNGTKYYYVKNLQGDVTAITNASAQVVVTYYYDAWGRALPGTDTSGVNIGTINPIRYRGYYYDTETGLYFLQSRYYDPEICRFLSADILIDTSNFVGFNIFAYCADNPVNGYDPYGYAQFDACKDNFGVICACAIGTYTLAAFAADISGVAKYASDAFVENFRTFVTNVWNLFESIVDSITVLTSSLQSSIIAQNLGDIASQYGVFQCVEATKAMVEYLIKKGLDAKIVAYVTAQDPGYILSISSGYKAISANGKHFGVLFNGKIYCNVHPEGLDPAAWENDFYSMLPYKVFYFPISWTGYDTL